MSTSVKLNVQTSVARAALCSVVTHGTDCNFTVDTHFDGVAWRLEAHLFWEGLQGVKLALTTESKIF